VLNTSKLNIIKVPFNKDILKENKNLYLNNHRPQTSKEQFKNMKFEETNDLLIQQLSNNLDQNDNHRPQTPKLNITKPERKRAQSAYNNRIDKTHKIPTQMIIPTINLFMPDSSNRDKLYSDRDNYSYTSNNFNSLQSNQVNFNELNITKNVRPNTARFTHNFNISKNHGNNLTSIIP